MSDEEFGDLTLAQLEALLARKQADDRRQFLRSGIIAAAVINSSFGYKGDPISPMDFVPGEKEEGDLTRMTPEQQMEYLSREFGKKKTVRR